LDYFFGWFVHFSIHHRLDLKWWRNGSALAGWAAGRFLIHDIAGKTLAGLKRKVEAQEYISAIPLP
jgi:hypothetical protein